MTVLADLAAQYADSHGTDKAAHGYVEHYERHLGYLSGGAVFVVEIGVGGGGSLRMWRDWFERGLIVGIDKNPNAMVVDEPRIETFRRDAATKAAWSSLVAADVIIDDGSHLAEEIVTAWKWAWPTLMPGGWYVIEDLATQYSEQFSGGDGGSAATSLVDFFCREAMRGEGVSEFHVYREIAFIRKAGG